MRRGCLALALASLFVLLPAAAARTQSPGALDPTFGPGGIVTTPFGADDIGLAIARQADGKLVVAGCSGVDNPCLYNVPEPGAGVFALARYNADGTLDTTFGGDGRVTTDVPGAAIDGGPGFDIARAVAIQADGKIVAVGDTNVNPASRDFALARYNADGSPDTSFGGDGIVTTEYFNGYLFAVAIQDNGRIVVAGKDFDEFALARFMPNGDPDTSFGGDGFVTTDMPGSSGDRALAVVIQPDGKIAAAGIEGVFDTNFALVRYNAHGDLDTSFGGDGRVITDFGDSFLEEARALVLQSDNKLIAAGSADEPACPMAAPSRTCFALARYNADGSLDNSFGDGGKVTTQLSCYPVSKATAVGIGPNGKPIAAGWARPSNTADDLDFALARYNADGSLDASFDGDGKLTTGIAPPGPFGAGQLDRAQAVAIQPDGKPVAAGFADMGPPDHYDFDFALVRYLPDGDSTPAEGGCPTYGGSTPPEGGGETDGDSTPAEGGGDGGGEISLERRVLKVKKGKVLLKLGCPDAPSGGCDGTLTLRAKKLRTRSARKSTTLGRATFSIAAGETKAVKVKLSKKARKALKKAKKHKLKANASAKYTDPSGTEQTTNWKVVVKG